MANVDLPAGPIPESRYLELERAHEWKHEYRDGQMVAMPHVNRHHSLIVGGTLTSLNEQLRDRPCEVMASQMRVLVPATRLYTYPDVVVVCGVAQLADEHEDTLLNPLVIVEVVAPVSERYDRGEKFRHYRRLDSLREYLLIAQDAYRIERFARQEDGRWRHEEAIGRGARLVIAAIDCTLALADVYAKVHHDPAQR